MPKATWTPGTVQAIGSIPRSYVVQGENDGVYNRNNIHITSREVLTDKDKTDGSVQRMKNNEPAFSTSMDDHEGMVSNRNRLEDSPYVTKAGRKVKKPNKLKDYIEG